MIGDALLAYAHVLSIFVLASILVGELFLFRKVLPIVNVRRLAAIDRWYGIMAGVVIATGLCRFFFGLKGPAFYEHNHVFWTKMLLFVIVALLSIFPTIAFIKWSQRPVEGDVLVLGAAEYARMSRIMWIEVVLFALIPLCAVFMARGL